MRLIQLLLARPCDTLGHRFAGHGYRTVGLMPGLKRAWPEGPLYGYDRIYEASSLDSSRPALRAVDVAGSGLRR